MPSTGTRRGALAGQLEPHSNEATVVQLPMQLPLEEETLHGADGATADDHMQMTQGRPPRRRLQFWHMQRCLQGVMSITDSSDRSVTVTVTVTVGKSRGDLASAEIPPNRT